MSVESSKLQEMFGLSQEELDALTAGEKQIGPPNFTTNFAREHSVDFRNGNVPPDEETSYWSHQTIRVETTAEIPQPEFRITVDGSGNVVVEIDNMEDGLIPIFEFDCDPGFNTNRILRMPTLATMTNGFNLVSSKGAKLSVFNSTSRQYSLSNRVKMPVRPHYLFLKMDGQKPDFESYAKLSDVLTFGLQGNTKQKIDEVYNFAMHHFLWGDDRYMKTGFELFSCGVGGCGNVNNFVGEMLEMQDVRYRLVSGFNPIVRLAYPGGGHSAIELLVDGKWTFADAYLDVLATGYSAKDIAEGSPFSDYHVFHIDNTKYPEETYGKSVTLGRLFRYRMYSDLGGRNITYTMINLGGDEDSYGLNWELRKRYDNEVLNVAADILPQQTLHVRGRFLRSDQPITYGLAGQVDSNAALGDWNARQIVLDAADYFKP